MIDITGRSLKCKTAVALGIFDGVHCGHRKIISTTVKYSKDGLTPAVFTFSAEGIPQKHGRPYEYIYSNRQKFEIIDQIGAEYIYSPNIDDVFHMSGEEFAEKILVGSMNARMVVCGENFRFGRGAACGVCELMSFGRRLGFEVSVCCMERKNGNEVSSDAIRRLLKNGKVSEAGELLGQLYYINSEVTVGNKIGRTLDFPTINQLYGEKQLVPRKGVYRTLTLIDGKTYNSITNVGVKPTIEKNTAPLAETHILDYSGNLYGKIIEVRFLRFVRDEKKFSSVEELKNQVHADIARVRAEKADIVTIEPLGKE